MAEKTQAMRVLEGKGAEYEALCYDDSLRDAGQVAAALDLPCEQLFKTLVVTRPKGKSILALVPANARLDLKKLAREAEEKKLKMAGHALAEELTGLQVGGISALCLLNKGFDVWIHNSIRDLEKVYVSAGKRGWQVKVGADDLTAVTQARVADIATLDGAGDK